MVWYARGCVLEALGPVDGEVERGGEGGADAGEDVAR